MASRPYLGFPKDFGIAAETKKTSLDFVPFVIEKRGQKTRAVDKTFGRIPGTFLGVSMIFGDGGQSDNASLWTRF